MWVNVALALVAVAWLVIAGGVGCAIGRAVRIADLRDHVVRREAVAAESTSLTE